MKKLLSLAKINSILRYLIIIAIISLIFDVSFYAYQLEAFLNYETFQNYLGRVYLYSFLLIFLFSLPFGLFLILTKRSRRIAGLLYSKFDLEKKIQINNLIVTFLYSSLVLLIVSLISGNTFFIVSITIIFCVLLSISNELDPYDLSNYYLIKFIEDNSDIPSLNRALLSINEILDSPFERKTLYIVSQTIYYAIFLGETTTLKKIKTLKDIISKEEETRAKIAMTLSQIENTCSIFLKDFRSLGYKERIPFRENLYSILRSQGKEIISKGIWILFTLIVGLLLYLFFGIDILNKFLKLVP